MAAAQALSSIFTKVVEPRTGSNSDRASSADISSTHSDRPIARPMVCTCSACVSDYGPVRTYSAPACPCSHNVRTATAARSRSSVGAVGASRYGQRTTLPARICGPQADWYPHRDQQLTRCETLTPYAETSLPPQRARSSSCVPFESQWLILYPIQPTAGKACSLQTTHQIGHFAGRVPDDPRFVIRDHA
jgi:hypothetical protein